MQNQSTPAPEECIRAWRKFRGMTQEELASRVNLSTPGISMIERGKQGLTVAKLAEFAEALGVTMAELLSMPPEDSAAQKADLRREALAIFDSLPAHLQQVYLAQTRALLAAAQAPEPDQADHNPDLK